MLHFVKNKIKFNRQVFTALLFSLCLFILSKPYFVWDAPTFNKLILILLIFMALINIRLPSQADLFPIFFFVFYVIYEANSNSSNLNGYISKFSIIFILLMRIDKSLYYLKYFKYLCSISLFLSLFVYVLIVLFDFTLPYNSISPLNLGKGLKYVQYPFLVSEGPLGFRYLNIRFCGMFDEPGVVGSIAVIFLLIDKYSLKSKQNIVIFIAGILSFSFYFYLCSIVYLLYKMTFSNRLKLIIFLSLLYFFTKDQEIVSFLIWDRFTIEDGRLKGDNRSSALLDSKYSDFIHSDDLFTGRGLTYALDYGVGTASYKLIIISYGLIFSVSVCIAFMSYSYFHIKRFKYVIAFWFLFFSMIFQRFGFILDPPRFFLFIACIYALEQIANPEKRKINILLNT